MKCKYCGTELPKGTKFCTNCGKDLSSLRKCVKCGEIIDDDATFCPYCGAEQPVYLEDSPYKKWIKIIVGIIVIAGVGAGTYFYHENQIEKQRQAAIADSIATQDSIKRVEQEQAAIAKAKADSVHRADSIAAARKAAESAVILNGEFVKKDFTLAGDFDQDDYPTHIVLHVTIFSNKKIRIERYVKYQNAPEGQNTENTTYDDAYITDEYNGKNTGIEWVTANGDCIHSLTPQNENGTSWEYGCGALGGGFFGTVTLQK